MTKRLDETFYRIQYRDPKENQIRELKAKSISDSSLGLGFVRISDFLFEKSSLLVQPSEEHMSKRFENVKSFHLSIYNIISIEELGMEHLGLSFKNDRSNLVPLPNAPQPPE